jgi:hypothetical protein
MFGEKLIFHSKLVFQVAFQSYLLIQTALFLRMNERQTASIEVLIRKMNGHFFKENTSISDLIDFFSKKTPLYEIQNITEMDDVGSDLSCSDVVASSSDEDENSLMVDELVLFVDTDENDSDDDSHSSLHKKKKLRTTSSLASETSSGESTGQFFDDFPLMRRMDFSRIEERGFHVAYLCFDRKGLHKQTLCFGQVRASAYGPDSFVLKSMMIPQDPHRLLTTSYHAQEIPSYTFVPILIEFVRVVGVRFEEGECRVNSFSIILIVFHHLQRTQLRQSSRSRRTLVTFWKTVAPTLFKEEQETNWAVGSAG